MSTKIAALGRKTNEEKEYKTKGNVKTVAEKFDYETRREIRVRMSARN